MKTTKIYGILLTLICAIALVPASGWAAWVDCQPERNILDGASEAGRASADLLTSLVYVTPDDIGLQQLDKITLTLTGGAVFNAAPVLVGSASFTPLPEGGAGTNFASWRVDSDQSGPVTLEFQTDHNFNGIYDDDNGIFDVTGVAADGEVDAVVWIQTLVLGNTTTLINSTRSMDLLDGGCLPDGSMLFVGATSAEIDITAEQDTATVTADLGPYTQFLDVNDFDPSDFTAEGTFVWYEFMQNSNEHSLPAMTGFDNGSVLYTLTGDFTGIDEIHVDSDAYLVGSSAAGTPNGAYTNMFMINATMDKAYAVNSIAIPWGYSDDNLWAQALILAGDDAIPQAQRSFTLQVQKLADTDWAAHSILDDTLVYSIVRDGATRRLLNVPGPSAQDQPFIRISNPTAVAGKVFGTMWAQDGTVIGEGVEMTVLEPNATEVFDIADLQTLFGDWTGRARMEISGEMTDMGVMGLVRSPADVLTNMSTGAPIPDSFKGSLPWMGGMPIIGNGSSGQLW